MAKPIVFISYARKDGAELANRLLIDLQSLGYDSWLDTKEILGGATWTREIEEALDRSDVVLALLTIGSYVSEICRAEQLRALRRHKCVIPLRAQSGDDIIPIHLEAKNYRDFAASYEEAFAALLDDIERREGVPFKERFKQTYVTAPLLPDNYVERPEALSALRDTVFTEGRGRNIALTALHGMGGIGKSVLAAALCRDEITQHAFPDGIVWVTAGRESVDVVAKMREVAKAIGDDLSRYDTELGSTTQYRSAMRSKAALVVVDDVWNARDLEPFRAESPRSRLLFTTRNAEIAGNFGAYQHSIGFLTEMQSRDLLATGSGLPIDALPPEADDLVRECGYLPLALGMVGAMMRNKSIVLWRRVLEHLRAADLAKIKASVPDYPHTDLLRAIQVSVDTLEERDRERYLALAVLLEDMPASPAIQRTLWNVNEGEAQETAELFIGLSLAQRDGENILIHDLQLDYVRAQFPDRASLILILEALRLSANIVAKDALQFAGQLTGRLLPHREQPVIADFIVRITAGAPRPWLRLLHPSLHPPGTPLMRIMEGHSGYVPWSGAGSGRFASGFRFMGRELRILGSDTNVFHGVGLTPSGRYAVLAWEDNTLRIFDLDSGRQLRCLKGHSDHVTGVATSGEGRLAISASYDGTLRVWELHSGRNIRTIQAHVASVNELAVTADGKRVVSASADWSIRCWDLETGRELRTLKGTPEPVTSVAITPDGRLAISSSSAWTPTVWNLDSGRILRFLVGHSDEVTGIAVTPDGRRAITASQDNTLKVWDLDSGIELRTFFGHRGGVNGLAIAQVGRRAVSASRDGTLKVWDIDSGAELVTLEGHSDHITRIAVNLDGTRAVSASRDRTIMVWDIASTRTVSMLEGHAGLINGLAVTPNGHRVISASGDATLSVWDINSGRVIHNLRGHSRSVSDVAVAPDGHRAVSCSEDKTLRIWNLDSGSLLTTLEGHREGVTGVAITPDGRLVVSGSRDTNLKVWELNSGKFVRTLTGHSNYIYGIALSPDGRRVVSASRDKTLKVWDIEDGRVLKTLEGHSDWVYKVALTPDGKRAVSVSEDKSVKLWDLESGAELHTFAGHSEAVKELAVTSDGRRAISASNDGMLMLWDMASGRLLHTLRGHSGPINRLAVSQGGSRAISASSDKSVRLWDLDSGKAAAMFSCDGSARCCAFVDSSQIVAGGGGRVYFLKFEDA